MDLNFRLKIVVGVRANEVRSTCATFPIGSTRNRREVDHEFFEKISLFRIILQSRSRIENVSSFDV